MKKCEAPDCGRMISHDLLMCGPHWRQVPDEIQREVYTTWGAVRRKGVSRATWIPYLAAIEKARDAVSPREVPRGENMEAGA